MSDTSKLRLLHVGSGPRTKADSTAYFSSDAWVETRLDIDPSVRPDITGSLVDLSGVADESYDGLYASHCIEHLYPQDVDKAIKNFMRVLQKDGHMVITCPDLQTACARVAEGRPDEAMYQSKAGPITPLDVIFGYQKALAGGNIHMAHHWGFIRRTLEQYLRRAGFQSIWTARVESEGALYAVARKIPTSKTAIIALVQRHFPDYNP
ncbi:class I SAM-dependent methyltransferase, partial [Desulfovibrio sp. OttesenSCG-928-A18]|nr:class I SAM-dependent methyltransferase [Desulfovibrio sp. OttesenSCG-928-A18]